MQLCIEERERAGELLFRLPAFLLDISFFFLLQFGYKYSSTQLSKIIFYIISLFILLTFSAI